MPTGANSLLRLLPCFRLIQEELADVFVVTTTDAHVESGDLLMRLNRTPGRPSLEWATAPSAMESIAENADDAHSCVH
jgi:hypothetical protein